MLLKIVMKIFSGSTTSPYISEDEPGRSEDLGGGVEKTFSNAGQSVIFITFHIVVQLNLI